MIEAGDIIYIFDDTTRPPKPKFVVCVCPEEGMFFRINSKDNWPDSVLIDAASHTKALKYDSYISCSGPLEIDDTIVDEAIRTHGRLGSVSKAVMTKVRETCLSSDQIAQNDKVLINASLTKVYGD